MKWISWAVLAALCVAVAAAAGNSVFSKDNLVAWCIVPFDAKKRNPEERAEMLKRLGITRLAYDWRDKDIPTFDREVDALQKYKIKLQSFWFPCGADPGSDQHVAVIFDLLKRRHLKTELWFSFEGDDSFSALPQEQKIDVVSRAVSYVAQEAGKLGCTVGLYNHGGWFGEPENQIAIIQRVSLRNVGIVYNFHHGHEQLDRFPELFAKMLPYLMTVNINGMRKGGPMILPVGEGDEELSMLKIIRNSSYHGPIGILDHREELDAEQSLKENLAGLQKLLREMGDNAALATY